MLDTVFGDHSIVVFQKPFDGVMHGDNFPEAKLFRPESLVVNGVGNLHSDFYGVSDALCDGVPLVYRIGCVNVPSCDDRVVWRPFDFRVDVVNVDGGVDPLGQAYGVTVGAEVNRRVFVHLRKFRLRIDDHIHWYFRSFAERFCIGEGDVVQVVPSGLRVLASLFRSDKGGVGFRDDVLVFVEVVEHERLVAIVLYVILDLYAVVSLTEHDILHGRKCPYGIVDDDFHVFPRSFTSQYGTLSDAVVVPAYKTRVHRDFIDFLLMGI